MNIVKEYLCVVLLSLLTAASLPETRGAARRQEAARRQSGRQECPRVRFRRKGCSYRYECKQECKEKKDCKTTYQYKCKEYKRQECKNVWQNECKGNRRGKRSPRRPYWLDKNNIEVIYNSQDFPLQPSDIPFADSGSSAGATFAFASPPKSKSCWKKVRKCEWKTYRTSCGNTPTTTCKPEPVQECKRRCKNRWYCDKCPAPTTPRPVGPTTPRPRPQPVRPTPPPAPGPPAPPPPGVFIGPPGVPSKRDPAVSVIDARRSKKGRP